jgi:GT2 family glycosyltransferase
MKISIVIITYNRRDRINFHLKKFSEINYKPLEIIFVDNCSDQPIDDLISTESRAILVRNKRNFGAVGRNFGMKIASGDIIITLDDDVYGINDSHLNFLKDLMLKKKKIAAVNFCIQEEGTGQIIDWCHPYDQDLFANKELETNDISEGAVAFRRTALQRVGLYPEYFFISHEGPDLAMRLINAGMQVIYSPAITVIHACDMQARSNWRRYYFDTRNQLWLVLRNFTIIYGLKRLIIGWCGMLVYSIRDGYFRYWLYGVHDALKGIPIALHDRSPLKDSALKRLRIIEKRKPGFLIMLKKRLSNRKVQI